MGYCSICAGIAFSCASPASLAQKKLTPLSIPTNLQQQLPLQHTLWIIHAEDRHGDTTFRCVRLEVAIVFHAKVVIPRVSEG